MQCLHICPSASVDNCAITDILIIELSVFCLHAWSGNSVPAYLLNNMISSPFPPGENYLFHTGMGGGGDSNEHDQG